jgi:hypothetical protein
LSLSLSFSPPVLLRLPLLLPFASAASGAVPAYRTTGSIPIRQVPDVCLNIR